jgi:hypothetical protein
MDICDSRLGVLAVVLAKKMGVSRMAVRAVGRRFSVHARTTIPRSSGRPHVALKMVEMMLDESPEHAGLLMTACSGFYSIRIRVSAGERGRSPIRRRRVRKI